MGLTVMWADKGTFKGTAIILMRTLWVKKGRFVFKNASVLFIFLGLCIPFILLQQRSLPHRPRASWSRYNDEITAKIGTSKNLQAHLQTLGGSIFFPNSFALS